MEDLPFDFQQTSFTDRIILIFAAFVACALACGCSAELCNDDLFAPADFDMLEPPPTETIEPAPDAGQPVPPVRVLVVTPDEDLTEVSARAVEELTKATGLQIQIGPGGLPLMLTDELGSRARPLCGQALADAWCTFDECPAAGGRIYINATPEHNCRNWRNIAHELGHVISRWGACTESGELHVGRGAEVMHAPSGGEVGPQSVRLLCSCGICPSVDGLDVAAEGGD